MQIRKAAVAGTFYPGDADALSRSVDRMLAEAKPGARVPKAMIVPHAGYIYSGPIAAHAYARVKPAASKIRRVVLLGPSHFVPMRGLTTPDAELFETPLGNVKIASAPGVPADALSHAREHSLEVQVPFLQRVLGDFELIPIAVGRASAKEVGAVIDELWGGPETLVLISSDLSHYLPYETAREVDRKTADRIVALGPDAIDHEEACGATPINGFLHAARKRRLGAELIDLRNSGDTAGSRDQVVGYGAFAFHELLS